MPATITACPPHGTRRRAEAALGGRSGRGPLTGAAERLDAGDTAFRGRPEPHTCSRRWDGEARGCVAAEILLLRVLWMDAEALAGARSDRRRCGRCPGVQPPAIMRTSMAPGANHLAMGSIGPCSNGWRTPRLLSARYRQVTTVPATVRSKGRPGDLRSAIRRRDPRPWCRRGTTYRRPSRRVGRRFRSVRPCGQYWRYRGGAARQSDRAGAPRHLCRSGINPAQCWGRARVGRRRPRRPSTPCRAVRACPGSSLG